ncbi:hypothetical protein RRG08_046487 [Elysia crispata]|uniref:Uncharacterized protein n=1 Tax=Elysia crispata TaxID=231223 RepID=A0AAE0YIG2_9GAST|nr:hypothetical protein RRG08_046487 [Elysia crispata]
MKFHLNVEICSSVKSIKYVLKYVHKASDQANFQGADPSSRDDFKDKTGSNCTPRIVYSPAMLRSLRPPPIESQCLNCAAPDTPASTETKRRKRGKKGGVRARYRRRAFRPPLPAIVWPMPDKQTITLLAWSMTN